MIRVLRIINRLNIGGPTYNAAYLSKYQFPEFKTLLIGGRHNSDEESSEYVLKELGIKPIIIQSMQREIGFRNDIVSYNIIKEVIKRFKPHIVHTHAAKAGSLGRYAAIHCDVPVIIHTFHGHVFHSYFSDSKTLVYKSIEKWLANRSTKIIAISEKQKEELSSIHKICDESKIEIVPLGFDLSKFRINTEEKRLAFRKKYKIQDNEIAIGIIGRIVPIKNHILFINSLKYLLDNTKVKIRAFVIGDGNDRVKLEERAKELDIDFCTNCEIDEPKVLTFTSWIKDIDSAIHGLDIVAMTSLNEGTPVSLIEAQAANKPIVTTNVGGIEDVIIPYKTALLCNSFDSIEFGDNLASLVNNERLREQMCHEGWDFVKEKFHYTRLVKDMSKIYYTELEKKGINVRKNR